MELKRWQFRLSYLVLNLNAGVIDQHDTKTRDCKLSQILRVTKPAKVVNLLAQYYMASSKLKKVPRPVFTPDPVWGLRRSPDSVVASFVYRKAYSHLYFKPTRLNCRDESRRRCERTRRQLWPSLQFPVGLYCWATEVGDKWRHNNVIVEKVISIKIHVGVYSQTAMFSLKIIIDPIRRQSSCRELLS